MAYIGKSPSGTGVRQRYYFTATGGETRLSGADDNGLTLSYSDGAYVDVLLNGIELVAGTDYNTNTANTIAGLAALAASEVVTVTVYDIFTVADTVSAKNGGTFSGNVGLAGNDLILDADADSKIEASTDDTINIISGGTTIATATSGGLETPKNHTSTVSSPASGSLVLSGIPNWANKVTLVTHNISPASSASINIRVTVGGSAITTSIYKYTLFRNTNGGTATVQDEGSGDTAIITDGFTATDGTQNWIFNFYRVDDYIYKFNGTHWNERYSQWRISIAGSITTTAAIDGFDIVASTGNLDDGKARAFWE